MDFNPRPWLFPRSPTGLTLGCMWSPGVFLGVLHFSPSTLTTSWIQSVLPARNSERGRRRPLGLRLGGSWAPQTQCPQPPLCMTFSPCPHPKYSLHSPASCSAPQDTSPGALDLPAPLAPGSASGAADQKAGAGGWQGSPTRCPPELTALVMPLLLLRALMTPGLLHHSFIKPPPPITPSELPGLSSLPPPR